MAIRSSGSGHHLTGPTVTYRNCTILAWCNSYSGTGVVFGATSGASQLFVYFDGTGLFCGGNNGYVQQSYTIATTQRFLVWVRIDSSGNATFGIGSPRAGGDVAVVTERNSALAAATFAVDNFSAPLVLLALDASNYPLNGSVERVTIFNSALSDSALRAAAQIVASPYNAGAPTETPTGAWGYYPLASTSDLTDHSGNGRTAFTQASTNTNETGIQQPAKPGVLASKIVCLGDSITHGYPAPATGYPVALATLRSADTVVNAGHDGARWVDTWVSMYADLMGVWDSSKCNIVVLNTAINNIVDGATAAAVLALEQHYALLAQAMGFAVVYLSTIPTGAPTYPARTTYNASLAASAVFDYLIDNGADAYYDPSNGAKYTDQLHLTPAAYSHMAGNVDAGLTTWIASFTSSSVADPGIATETDAALALGAQHVAQPGVSTQTNTALGLSSQHVASVGLATGSNSALGLASIHTAPVGVALGSDAALALSSVHVATPGTAVESSSALGLATVHSAAPGIALESSTSYGLAASPAPGIASETGAALALDSQHLAPPSVATETSSALTLAAPGGPPGVALESDVALSLSAARVSPVGLASESSEAEAPIAVFPPGIAFDLSEALGLSSLHVAVFGLALESDAALDLASALPLPGRARFQIVALTSVTGTITQTGTATCSISET